MTLPWILGESYFMEEYKRANILLYGIGNASDGRYTVYQQWPTVTLPYECSVLTDSLIVVVQSRCSGRVKLGKLLTGWPKGNISGHNALNIVRVDMHVCSYLVNYVCCFIKL